MNLKKLVALVVIFLVCSLGPASATQIDGSVHETEQYLKDCKKEQGFFC